MAKTLDISIEEILETEKENSPCTLCKDLGILMSELKLKCVKSTRADQLKLLTLAPETWSIAKTAIEFKVTEYMVRKTRDLKKESGILAEPDKLKGKSLSATTVEKIQQFYEDDEYSRMCPGKVDCLSIFMEKEFTNRNV